MAAEMTVSERLNQIGPTVRQRVRPYFLRQRMAYPPARLAFVVIKDEMLLKVFADTAEGEAAGDPNWQFVMQYALAKLSGGPGPKLRAGDKQVPESVYRITYLHPQSKYWLSLGLDYPNAFDLARAREDGRRNLGGDIMIHGWWFSTGCVAVGNTASEDLFVLAGDVGSENVRVIISPTDFRRGDRSEFQPQATPAWTKQLYARLEDELADLGNEGLTTSARRIAYPDIQAPRPKPKGLLEGLLDALVEAAETSVTQTRK